MTRNLTILLVEDDQNACKEIKDYIDSLEDISLAGITNEAAKALEMVQELLPDAIILDLELHQGGGNGLTFLQNLHQMSLPLVPYVLITTNNSSSVTYDCAREMGADFIMFKHQSDYSSKNVVDFIRMMKNMIFSKADAASDNSTAETAEQRTKRIIRMITLEMDRIGINPKAVGYAYLMDAIQLVIDGQNHNLCPIIGKKYGKTDSSVERAMQNAINRAWRTSDIDDLLKYYTAKIRSDKGVATITEFVYYYARKLKNDL